MINRIENWWLSLYYDCRFSESVKYLIVLMNHFFRVTLVRAGAFDFEKSRFNSRCNECFVMRISLFPFECQVARHNYHRWIYDNRWQSIKSDRERGESRQSSDSLNNKWMYPLLIRWFINRAGCSILNLVLAWCEPIVAENARCT